MSNVHHCISFTNEPKDYTDSLSLEKKEPPPMNPFYPQRSSSRLSHNRSRSPLYRSNKSRRARRVQRDRKQRAHADPAVTAVARKLRSRAPSQGYITHIPRRRARIPLYLLPHRRWISALRGAISLPPTRLRPAIFFLLR